MVVGRDESSEGGAVKTTVEEGKKATETRGKDPRHRHWAVHIGGPGVPVARGPPSTLFPCYTAMAWGQ
jgi:hypothetical protein